MNKILIVFNKNLIIILMILCSYIIQLFTFFFRAYHVSKEIIIILSDIAYVITHKHTNVYLLNLSWNHFGNDNKIIITFYIKKYYSLLAVFEPFYFLFPSSFHLILTSYKHTYYNGYVEKNLVKKHDR